MLIDISKVERIYVVCGHVDMRRQIDGLAAIVKQTHGLDPFSNSIYLFCGRRKDRIKALYWHINGFVLLYKRLERGRYQWPNNENEARRITQQQLRWLMEGLSVEQPKALQPVQDLQII